MHEISRNSDGNIKMLELSMLTTLFRICTLFSNSTTVIFGAWLRISSITNPYTFAFVSYLQNVYVS